MEGEKLTSLDYAKLVEELVKSPETLESLSQYLPANPLFYLRLFKTIEVLRASEASNGRQNVADLLDELKIKLFEYNNGIPVDLPKSVLADKSLKDTYLGDYSGVAHIEDKWNTFQSIIWQKATSIPKKSELLFLHWCEQMLEVNLARHKKRCTNPLDCPVNQGYDRRLQYIIRLIEEKTPQPVQDKNQPAEAQDAMKKSGNKIQWLGTQKELAELFIQLRAKGWIAGFEPETLKDCFTNANSIQQYLKPGEFTPDLGGTFEQVFTPEYLPKFRGIYANPKPDSND